MTGKIVKFALGPKEQLEKLSKELSQVEIYLDEESGTLYVVPKDNDLKINEKYDIINI